MNTVIYMVRHAHSVFNIDEEETRGLSEKGWQDAALVTEILKKEDIDVVVSSSYARAVQTVEGIAQHLGAEIEIDPRFRERDLASSDHKFEDFDSAIRRVFDDPDYAHPGGESNNEVQVRGVAALRDVLNKHAGKRIAIGIHGNIMTITMNHFDNRYDLDFWAGTSKPDIYKMVFDGELLLEVSRLWKPTE